MYFRKHGMHFVRIENAYVCGKTGVIAFELLPGEEAHRAAATDVAEQHFELISQLKGDFQESKETTEQLARAEVAHRGAVSQRRSRRGPVAGIQ